MSDLTVRGRMIRSDENGMICLNDIWSASGRTKNQRPNDWLRLPTTTRLTEAVLNRITGKSRNWAKSEFRSVTYTKVGANGGTFADVRMALGYAEFLDSKLALEVKEVFLRYKASDPLLADEILENATAEANLWVAARAEGRAIRNGFTETLRDHEVDGRGYGLCTDETYRHLFDAPAKQLKQQRGLPAKANLRDKMSTVELSALKFAEALATERITIEDSRGNAECKEATGRSASNVRFALDRERADRQRRLVR